MAALHYLKYASRMSDKTAIDEWLKCPCWQHLTCRIYFKHEYPTDQSTMSCQHERPSKSGSEKMLKKSLKSEFVKDLSKQSSAFGKLRICRRPPQHCGSLRINFLSRKTANKNFILFVLVVLNISQTFLIYSFNYLKAMTCEHNPSSFKFIVIEPFVHRMGLIIEMHPVEISHR